jgi:hypothetical protein
MAIAILVGDVTEVSDEVDTDQSGRPSSHGVELVAALGNVPDHTRLHKFMILPAAVIFLDHLRHHFFIIGGPDIRLSHVNLLNKICDFRL